MDVETKSKENSDKKDGEEECITSITSVTELHTIIKNMQFTIVSYEQEIDSLKKKLLHTEKQVEKSYLYSEELRITVERLNSDIHQLRKLKVKVNASSQTDITKDDDSESSNKVEEKEGKHKKTF